MDQFADRQIQKVCLFQAFRGPRIAWDPVFRVLMQCSVICGSGGEAHTEVTERPQTRIIT